MNACRPGHPARGVYHGRLSRLNTPAPLCPARCAGCSPGGRAGSPHPVWTPVPTCHPDTPSPTPEPGCVWSMWFRTYPTGRGGQCRPDTGQVCSRVPRHLHQVRYQQEQCGLGLRVHTGRPAVLLDLRNPLAFTAARS